MTVPVTTSGGVQYGRVCQLVVGKGGTGLQVQDLRIKFKIVKTIEPTPNPAVIKVYNLLPSHEAQIKLQYTDLLLNAGYAGSQKLIFQGNIKHVYQYREKNDHLTEIAAGDGDADFRNAIVNTTLAAGTTLQQTVDHLLSTMPNTAKGSVVLPGSSQRLFAEVLSGMTRNALHDLALDNGANWSIQDGQLHVVKTSAVLPGTAVVVNSRTGMLETPEINEKGITVRTLLNPDYRINGAIQLDNSNIKLKIKQGHSLTKNTKKTKVSVGGENFRLDPDGIYKIIRLEHHGDTRGTGAKSWMSELTCLGLSTPIPPPEVVGDPQDEELDD